MPKSAKEVRPSRNSQPFRPALTPEARENQLISLAIDVAEQQLRDGTASSQIITHYLKLGSSRDRLEREILEKQKDLIVAKTKSYETADELKALYQEAMDAMRIYSGNGDDYD